MAAAGIQLGFPGDLDDFALGVVIDAGEAHRTNAVQHRTAFYEPTTATYLDELAGLGKGDTHLVVPNPSFFVHPGCLAVSFRSPPQLDSDILARI